MGGRGDLSWVDEGMGCGWWTGGYSAGGEYVGGSTRKRRRGGLHPSNGTREPLSNRCRGGARSSRWLLRTLMSFSLASPPRQPTPGPLFLLFFHLRRRSLAPRPPRPPPSSSRLLFFVSSPPLSPSPSLSLALSVSLFPSLLPATFLSTFPLSLPPPGFSPTRRGGHDTCQSTADARSIPTDLGFSLRSSTSFFALSSTTTPSSSTSNHPIPLVNRLARPTRPPPLPPPPPSCPSRPL